MIINAPYVANWRHLSERRCEQTIRNNIRENRFRVSHDYEVGDQVYIKNNDIERKLNPQSGSFQIIQVYTNGTVKIQRSATVTERINIRRLHPGTSHSN